MIRQLCATLLVVLAALPFTRPFYTFDLSELFDSDPCEVCAFDGTSNLGATPGTTQMEADTTPADVYLGDSTCNVRRLVSAVVPTTCAFVLSSWSAGAIRRLPFPPGRTGQPLAISRTLRL